VVAFGVFNEQAGTEEVVIVAEVDFSDLEANRVRASTTADEIRRQVTRGSDISLRTVYMVERNWLLKTSSGKVARAANREKYLRSIRE
jgi:hypothetical protein